MSKKLIVIVLLFALILSSCTATADIKEPAVLDTTEYSYLQPEGAVTGTKTYQDGKTQEFTSNGRPPAEQKTIMPTRNVVVQDGITYFANNEDVFTYDGKLVSEIPIPDSPDYPMFIEVYQNKLFYLTELKPQIRVFDLKDLKHTGQHIGEVYMDEFEMVDFKTQEFVIEKSISFYDFLVAEAHVFYKGEDKKLHRVTVNGNEDTIIADKIVKDICYSYGYIYFLDENNHLYRLETSGENLELISDHIIGQYYPLGTKVFYAGGEESYAYYIKEFEDQKERKIDDAFFDPQYAYGIIGMDTTNIYFERMDMETSKVSIISMPLFGGGARELYKGILNDFPYDPILIGEYIYYEDMCVHRIKTDGTDLMKLGPDLKNTHTRE